ncbi:MAG: phosphotransferase enzyme family protein [Acholeplasmataceae bacterium]
MRSIVNQFLILGNILDIKAHKEGHINDTYYIQTDHPMTYVLQRINHEVFENVDQLMSNIKRITIYLSDYHTQNGNQHYQVLELIDTKDYKTYVCHNKNYYRMYKVIENAITYQEVPHIDYMEKTGVVLGQFQLMLEAFNMSELYETIPGFHDTLKRYHDFEKAVLQTSKDRYKKSADLIEALRQRKDYAHQITEGINQKQIPVRVTHNDTKLNNILFDRETGHPICLIDFDTVMPGSALYDFGDAIRFACNTAKEDETDLSLVSLNLLYFKAFTKGYMHTVGHALTLREKELLALSPLVITYELTMRFLEDYLNHDRYFKVEYATHNLIRAKNQFALLCSMEENYEKMKAIVIDYNV